MVDTLKVKLDLTNYLNREIYLNNLKSRINFRLRIYNLRSEQTFFTANYKNLVIIIKGYMISISGSITKFCFGNNIELMNRAQFSFAIKSVGFELGIPFEQAIITRIDLAENFSVDHQVRQYLNCLTGISRASTVRYPFSVYFYRSCQTVVLYDKVQQLKKNDKIAYQRCKGQGNILRYEIRLRKDIARLTRQKDLRVFRLHSTSFLKALAQQWVVHYKIIIKKYVEQRSPSKTPADFKRSFEYQGLMTDLNGGKELSDIMDEINTAQKKNNWTATRTCNLRKYFYELYQDHRFALKSPLVKELDTAIDYSTINNVFYKGDTSTSQIVSIR